MVTTVPFNIGAEFFLPEFPPGGRCRCIEAAFVPVPEAAIDEDDEAVTWQDEVGCTGKVLAMQPEPVSAGMKELPEEKLRFGVFPANATHHPRAGRSVNHIRHRVTTYVTRLSIPFRLFDQ